MTYFFVISSEGAQLVSLLEEVVETWDRKMLLFSGIPPPPQEGPTIITGEEVDR